MILDRTQDPRLWQYVILRYLHEEQDLNFFLDRFKQIIKPLMESQDYQVHYTFRKDEDVHNWYRAPVFYLSVRILCLKHINLNMRFEEHFHPKDFVVNPDEDHEWYKFVCFNPSERWNGGSLSILDKLSEVALDFLHLTPDVRGEIVHLFCNMMGLEEDIKTEYIKKWKRQIIGPSYYDLVYNQEYPGIYYHWKWKYEAEAEKYIDKK